MARVARGRALALGAQWEVASHGVGRGWAGRPGHAAPRRSETEEIRDWVLQGAVDASVDQKLPCRPCDQCKGETYVASLACHLCSCKYDPCAVTGYPVLRSEKARQRAASRLGEASRAVPWGRAFAPWRFGRRGLALRGETIGIRAESSCSGLATVVLISHL